VVSGAKGLLLHDSWPWLRDYSLARDNADDPTHAIPHATAHAAAHAAPHAAGATASSHPATSAETHSAACPCRTRRSVQLRCGPVLHLGRSQTAMVLQSSSHLRPADATASPSRSLQLRGWFLELAGGLVSPEEGVVLSGSRQGLPEPRWRLRPFGSHC